MANSSFVSLPARFVGRVVVRASASGWFWVKRLPRAGQLPSPACLFLPLAQQNSAARVAKAAAVAGFQSSVKPASAAAIAPLLSSSARFVVKVQLPAGATAAVGKRAIRNILLGWQRAGY